MKKLSCHYLLDEPFLLGAVQGRAISFATRIAVLGRAYAQSLVLLTKVEVLFQCDTGRSLFDAGAPECTVGLAHHIALQLLEVARLERHRVQRCGHPAINGLLIVFLWGLLFVDKVTCLLAASLRV